MRSVSAPDDVPVAVLWEVEWNGTSLRCAVFRHAKGLEMRVESAAAIVVSEPFGLQPRAVARATALHRELTRRGWRDTVRVPPGGDSGTPPAE